MNQRALEVYEKALWAEHPSTLASMGNLAFEEPRQLEGGQGLEDACDREENYGVGAGASRHASEHRRPCFHVEGLWPTCRGLQAKGEMCCARNSDLSY